ncbi:PREDICTED: galanin receptor type 1-like [Branchiostoma belcheri]|uniref:Galanin receptor type 1-like n=1 Tax=Branchiostoma belcheri TaxID=7741 RepID=A0A6P4YI56_BRABE|nr:PREDICTED: galanin receptor type 1-like [Branchiostoma belcheri]XP_019629021.1 PREDICTED: galanin receptor type 1-like [Branchiostoma belcheri]
MDLQENTTANTTAMSLAADEPRPESVIVPAIFAFIFCLGVFGNALVIAVLLRTGKEMQNTTNVFILNLSIADLFFIIFCVPFQATVYSLPEWVFGLFMCKFVHFCQCTTMLASIFNLVAMAIDRYLAVVHPVTSMDIRKPQSAWLAELVVWILAMGTASPYLVYYDIVNHGAKSEQEFCIEVWEEIENQRPVYIAFQFTFGYVLPLMIITICYCLVIKRLNATSKRSQANRAKKRITKMLIVVVVVFGICWLPHHIMHLWVNFGEFPYTMTTYVLKLFSHCMAYANSCLNPIIYAFLSTEFRKAVGELACHKRG